MSSNIVKCANCNVVINELLAFLSNVMDFMDEESIHQLCTTSFSDAEIVKAKTLLVDSVPKLKKMPIRRKQGKKKMSRDLQDIICLMKSADPETFPVFVAKELHRLPPVTFDHVDVTRLLRDILCLKNQLCALEERIVSPEDFNHLKSEVDHMKNASIIDDFASSANVNKKRGACIQNSFVFDSGPIGLNYVPQYVPIKSAVSNINRLPSLPRHSSPEAKSNGSDDLAISVARVPNKTAVAVTYVEAPSNTVFSKGARETDCQASLTYGGSAGVSETEHPAVSVEATASTVVSPLPAMLRQPSCADALDRSATNDTRSSVVKETISNATTQQRSASDYSLPVPRVSVRNKQAVRDSDSEWQIVTNKTSKRNYKFIGQRGCAATPEGKFRAADIKVPLFISNVSNETCENDIINYIKEKTNDIVSLKKINMKQPKKYNAYKVYVSKCNLELFLDDKFWPNGITFRRFVQFMYKTKPNAS